MVALLEPERLTAPASSERRRTVVEKHSQRGDEHFDAGQLKDALQEYDAAIAIAPDDSYLHNNRGATLARLGRLLEALEEFEAAIRLDPQNPMLARHKAFVLAEIGREREAIAFLEGFGPHPIVEESRKALVERALWRLVESGRASWAGGKPKPPKRLIKLPPGVSVSDLISEMRE
jgi:Flp pilus assembly protein TadD